MVDVNSLWGLGWDNTVEIDLIVELILILLNYETTLTYVSLLLMIVSYCNIELIENVECKYCVMKLPCRWLSAGGYKREANRSGSGGSCHWSCCEASDRDSIQVINWIKIAIYHSLLLKRATRSLCGVLLNIVSVHMYVSYSTYSTFFGAF